MTSASGSLPFTALAKSKYRSSIKRLPGFIKGPDSVSDGTFVPRLNKDYLPLKFTQNGLLLCF
jgi:hypothetical protein